LAEEDLAENSQHLREGEELAWKLRRQLADATAKLRDRDDRLREIEASGVWKIAKPLWKLLRYRRNHEAIPYRDSELVHLVDWPRVWTTSRAKLLIEGWCFLRDGRELAGVLAQIGGRTYLAQYGIMRTDAASAAPDCATAGNSGFAVEVPVAPGTSILQLQAIELGGGWRPFTEREIFRDPSAPTDEIALPPHRLMEAVSGHDDDEEFRRSRLGGPRQLLIDLAAAGIDLTQIRDTLDFGCGCGRFLAGWLLLRTQMRLYGCDYNPELVRWCNANLPTVSVRENRLGQRLPFDTDSFDLVYLISVFTHLTLLEQRRLVREFQRVVRPGGYVYVTFHGEPFYQQLFALVENGEEQFRKNGFLIGGDEQEGTNDCWTLHSPEHLISLFDGFTPLKHFRASDRGATDVGSRQDSMIFQSMPRDRA
jgi:SAM-dependent methyltransferase